MATRTQAMPNQFCYSLRLVVRLLAQTVQLLRFPGVLALAAHKLVDLLRLLLGDADAIAVEPVIAQITTHVESAGGKNKL